jgi:rRNA-processing protein FCF1
MNIDVLIVVIIFVILAEVTYLVARQSRRSVGKKQGRPILVDTSVLIDGRIIAVAKSGFITETLVIPRSVVGELQFLADNADHDKRARARYGLDVVQELQSMPGVDVEILQDGSKASEGVDERLLSLAKKYSAAVCTIDYNLNKVAVVEGIPVLNVNELAQSLRMAYLPGERMLLELVQKGQDAHQGVGYLTDGTMVVVEHANKFIGQSVEIEFIRSLQTAAGKMMFAKRVETQTAQKNAQKPQGKRPLSAKQAEHIASKGQNTQTQKKQTKPRAKNNETPDQVQPAKVYHSDARNMQTAKKSNEQKASHSNNSSSKKRTSADREASLLDLVNKQ